jgi:deoxyadenosine/deoxycytidine kinase
MTNSTSNPIIISIDGNIGSGKSTLYTDLQTHFSNRNDICFVPEPVDSWTKIVDVDKTPILTNLYKDTKRYAFRFQMMAYISRLHLLREKVKENKYSIIISERSVQTDRHVFAKMLFDDDMIEHDEYQIYNQWFDEFLDDMNLGGIIYVRAEPEICADRVKIRGREGETIPLEYLQKCHQYHEDWLKDSENKLTIEANIDTRIAENQSVREEWIKTIDHWMGNEISKYHQTDTNDTNDTNDENLPYHHVKQVCNQEADKFTNNAIDKGEKPITDCPGCSHRFQENQLAHVGPNGCLKLDDDY